MKDAPAGTKKKNVKAFAPMMHVKTWLAIELSPSGAVTDREHIQKADAHHAEREIRAVRTSSRIDTHIRKFCSIFLFPFIAESAWMHPHAPGCRGCVEACLSTCSSFPPLTDHQRNGTGFVPVGVQGQNGHCERTTM
uniref:Transposase n=1 Tax=Panagrellus redivivus TaxID=6233 RepID=A0A7E4UN75_PANRE